jgi:hypothetical protein
MLAATAFLAVKSSPLRPAVQLSRAICNRVISAVDKGPGRLAEGVGCLLLADGLDPDCVLGFGLLT